MNVTPTATARMTTAKVRGTNASAMAASNGRAKIKVNVVI
jgi:hypothetical protein